MQGKRAWLFKRENFRTKSECIKESRRFWRRASLDRNFVHGQDEDDGG